MPTAAPLNGKDVAGFLVACAFPDRVSRRRHAGGYQLANGRSANLAGPDPLNKHRWLAVAEVGGLAKRKGDIIRTAAPLNPEHFADALAGLKTSQTFVEWDKKSGRFIAEQQVKVGQLVLDRSPLDVVPEDQKVTAVCNLIRQEGLSIFTCFAEFEILSQKVRLIRQHLHPDWPDLTQAVLLDSLEIWLAPYLTNITKLNDLKKIDLTQVCKDRLGYQRQQDLNQLTPESIGVPSGSKIKINYREDPPVLAVKLQEMFGLEQTPAILNGKVDLLVHLLSPAGRPVQVTQDLAGFWRSSYQEVKKEMKGRYPKHPWPDDPTQAVATRHTRRRT